jgi:hypothetical protein
VSRGKIEGERRQGRNGREEERGEGGGRKRRKRNNGEVREMGRNKKGMGV